MCITSRNIIFELPRWASATIGVAFRLSFVSRRSRLDNSYCNLYYIIFIYFLFDREFHSRRGQRYDGKASALFHGSSNTSSRQRRLHGLKVGKVLEVFFFLLIIIIKIEVSQFSDWNIQDFQAYSIWPVTCTGKYCIGHYNTRSQRFFKK